MQPKKNEEKIPSEGELGETLELMRLLWKIDHGLQATSKHMAATLGVTGPQRLVIRVVGQFPGIAASELSDILWLHPSTLTGVVQRLEHRQILKRTIDPNDRRRATFRLTGIGQAVNRCRTGTVEAAVRRAISRVTPDDLAAGEALLRKLGQELTGNRKR
ncbi:MAG: MarR family winged helix-turn-helix transcriptional regulator [Nitrospirota bacterium]|nr:MarR family winged helix-turn-helix transcriptional regulator [Nitrospirota bacterium]